VTLGRECEQRIIGAIQEDQLFRAGGQLPHHSASPREGTERILREVYEIDLFNPRGTRRPVLLDGGGAYDTPIPQTRSGRIATTAARIAVLLLRICSLDSRPLTHWR